jgi:hypothetical protein
VVDDPATSLRSAIQRVATLTRDRRPTGLRHDDADGDIGSIASDNAIGFDPLPVLRALSDARARVVVIGQVAGILHGSAELTGDLDLLWSGAADEAPAITRAFVSLGAHLTTADGEPIDDPDEAFRLPKVLFETETAAGDCCTLALPWGIDVAPFLDRAETTDIDGIVVRYLAAADLNSMRRASGRVKDVRRADELDDLQKRFS